MREVTSEMIKLFKVKQLGYDFMGYQFKKNSELSFHHLIVAHKNCKSMGLGEGYLFWNGAILVQRTSHEYLHTVETYDKDRFWAITSEMIDENVSGKIKIENLQRIRDILLSFEKEYSHSTNAKGKYIIKPHFVSNRIKLD